MLTVVGNQKQTEESGLWLVQTSVSFAGYAEGAKLILFPRITQRHE
jgi:hypothetical protein